MQAVGAKSGAVCRCAKRGRGVPRCLRKHAFDHRRPGNTTSYTFDSNDNVASVSKPLNSTTATTSYTYNSIGEAARFGGCAEQYHDEHLRRARQPAHRDLANAELQQGRI